MAPATAVVVPATAIAGFPAAHERYMLANTVSLLAARAPAADVAARSQA
ncbi:MAG TPA: hypothetical protein VLW50_04905 [Streptosporangiaceae bacterium]|nr:hypothetical protein [Streptosporangiaceae bacterium]